jgi:hypothetical protein
MAWMDASGWTLKEQANKQRLRELLEKGADSPVLLSYAIIPAYM